ncbi:hypothetical protein D7193_29825 [Micromonospora costi]|uniref:EcsC family protein n=1 Tax=Micromonospora costi TaxID=1530042 RepID=A0A3A9ZWM6_9ACTN|nr:hypothetical protein D7193_29825 [Micromonospora costi]
MENTTPATATAAEKTTPAKATAARKATPTRTTPRKAAPPTKIAPGKAAPPAKTAPGKVTRPRATPAQTVPVTKATPAADPAPETNAPAPAAAVPAKPELRAITVRMLDHPGFAPELLALAAVEALGPTARGWADRMRTAYPEATPDGLARLATRRFVRLAGVGGAGAALAGVFAPVAELAAVLWTQANLVLHLAAAYGRDPAHPDRAVELLVLAQVHPDAASARTALEAALAADGPGEAPWPRAAEAAWRLAAPLAAQAGGWLALRLASRLLPGAAVLAAAAGDTAAAERLAARAVAAYRPAQNGPGGPVNGPATS